MCCVRSRCSCKQGLWYSSPVWQLVSALILLFVFPTLKHISPESIYTGHVAGVPAGGDVLRQQDGEGVAAGQGERVLRPPVVRGQGWPLAVIAADIDNLQQLEERSRLVKGTIHLFRVSLFPVQR